MLSTDSNNIPSVSRTTTVLPSQTNSTIPKRVHTIVGEYIPWEGGGKINSEWLDLYISGVHPRTSDLIDKLHIFGSDALVTFVNALEEGGNSPSCSLYDNDGIIYLCLHYLTNKNSVIMAYPIKQGEDGPKGGKKFIIDFNDYERFLNGNFFKD